MTAMEDIDRIRERIAANVRAEMARAGMTAYQLSELLGIHRNTATDRLAGRVAFSAQEVTILAARLGVTPDRLLEVEAGHLPSPVRGVAPGVLGPGNYGPGQPRPRSVPIDFDS